MKIHTIPDFSRRHRLRTMGMISKTLEDEQIDDGTNLRKNTAAHGAELLQIAQDGMPQSLSATDAAVLAVHSGSPVMEIPGYMVPSSVKAIKAGTMALANKLALDLQNGVITQATFDAAMAALTPTPQ